MSDLEILNECVPFDLNAIQEQAESLFAKYPVKTQHWLGGLEQQIWGPKSPYKSNGRIPPGPLREVGLYIDRLYWQDNGNRANVLYLQRTKGQAVKPHRDPFTDKDYTTIFYFGDFTGRALCIPEETIRVTPGMVVRLRCTVGKEQGPLHWTTPHSGTCWTLIFNKSIRA